MTKRTHSASNSQQKHDSLPTRSKSSMTKIPRILHFVWVGDESKCPLEIEAWAKLNPSFEVQVWGNEDLKSGWMLAEWMRHYAKSALCGVADCMRWEILYKHGGIALDADSEPLRAIPDWMLEPDIWCCAESEVSRPGLLANGAVGSIPGHPLIGQIIQDLSEETPDGEPWEMTGPGRLTRTFLDHEYRNLTIFPSQFFMPKHFAGEEYDGSLVFARQQWKSTRGEW